VAWITCIDIFLGHLALNRGPFIDASYQVLVHLAQWFQRRRFLKIGQSETRIALTNMAAQAIHVYDCMLYKKKLFFCGKGDNSNLNIEDISKIQLATIRNKNCLWWPCLLMGRDEISKLYRGPSIDASYQVSVHLAEGFQRRRLKCEKHLWKVLYKD
jgi:hypothetical protein